MPVKRQRLYKNNKKNVSEQGIGTEVMYSPKGNRILDNVKCCECGKCGHYKKQCPEKGRSSPVQGCEEGNHNLDNVKKCYKCGKRGHYVKQCPENRISSPLQGCEVLTTVATRNLEGDNMPGPVASSVTPGGDTTQFGAPTTLPALPMPLSNRDCDSVKCFECGKRGHSQNQCVKCFLCGKRGHYQNQCDSAKCFECGQSGHYRSHCPKNERFSPAQDYEALLTVTTTNSEGGNMSKHETPVTLPTLLTTLENHNPDYSMCHEYGKAEHFENHCLDSKGFAPTQADAVLPTTATTDLEAKKRRISWKTRECGHQVGTRTISSEFETSACSLTTPCLTCGTSTSVSGQSFSMTAFNSTTPSFGRPSASEQQPAVKKLGLASNQLDLFGNSNTASPNMASDAPSPNRSVSAVTDTKAFGQPDALAFDSASRMDTLSCSVSTEAFSAQSTSSLLHACKSSTVSCDLSSIPVAGFKFMQQTSAGTFGSPSDHSSPFAGSPAFGMASSKSALFGSASASSACGVQSTSSLCGSSNTLVFGSGYYTSAFKNSTQLIPAFGATGTSASEQQSTTTAVSLNSNHSNPFVSKAIASNTLFGVPSQCAFGAPSTSGFGQSNITVMGKEGSMPALFGSSMPALFGSTATMSTSTSAFGFKSSMPSLFRTTSSSYGGQTTAPGNQSTTPGNQMTMPESRTAISESQATTHECQMATPGNQVTASGNQTPPPESQTTTPGCQTTTRECQMGISDHQKSIKTPYSSTQNISGKSLSILNKPMLKDKHCEELGREEYHRDNGYDQEQVQQAWELTQSGPIGTTNVASSFDQSPKNLTPKPPVVVACEDSNGGGDTPYKATKTSVWWDIENCQVPRGSDTYYIAQNISSALADAGYKGAVTISAYGDTHKIPKAVQQALSSTGIALNHVPAGVKDASDKKILVDMLFWAVDNPPPANYLLISGDRDFSNALHQLRLRRYNILLAHAPSVSQALVAAAKKVWQWSSLLSGGPPLRDLELGTKTSSANKSSFNGIKGPIAKRLKWKDQNAGETHKTFCVPQSEEGCDVHSEKLVSFPRVSMPEANEITGLKRASISSPSRENECAKRPRNSVDTSEQMPFDSMFHSERNPFDSQPFKVSQLFAPSNSAPSQNTTNNSFITQPRHQHIMFGPPHLHSMFNKSTINHHENTKPPEQFNGYQVHSSEVHRHIGYIVSALTELKANKISPTEENISNCICYGMGKQSIDVKMGLTYACENNMLTRYNLENGISFYVGKNEQVWECINVLNNDKHLEETWNAVRNFLSSASGQLAISSTECRYHAATVLKKSCLQHLPLGEVLQLLNMVIKFRKWIIPSPSGWQPLKFSIKVLPSGNAKD